MEKLKAKVEDVFLMGRNGDWQIQPATFPGSLEGHGSRWVLKALHLKGPTLDF